MRQNATASVKCLIRCIQLKLCTLTNCGVIITITQMTSMLYVGINQIVNNKKGQKSITHIRVAFELFNL